MYYILRSFLLFIISLGFIALNAQKRTVGLVKYSTQNQAGYMLYTPMNGKKTFLVDKCGKKVHEWTSNYFPGLSAYLFPDGSLLRTGTMLNPNFGLGIGGVLEKYDWNGNLTWSYNQSDTLEALHHDVQIMPNGNILAIVWEKRTVAECIAKGRNPANTTVPLWSEHIVELQTFGKDSFDIVWEWRAWDHMVQDFSNKKPNFGVVADHPELFDINHFETDNNGQDWFHLNSISYNPINDQIILNAHSLNEFYIIDHSTNLFQAAAHSGGNRGKGGDVLYRWGNPVTYGRGTSADQKLYKQHHAHWIKSEFEDGGSIMVFNNGWNRPDGNYSTIDVVTPPADVNGNYTISAGTAFGPTSAKIVYKAPVATSFYSQIISGAYSLPNGGLFITSGLQGRMFETDSKDSIVWQYINPQTSSGLVSQGTVLGNPSNNSVFRAEYYPTDFAGFASKTLSPIGEIETTPYAKTLCELASISNEKHSSFVKLSPMPFVDILKIENTEATDVQVFALNGQNVYSGKFESNVNLSFLNAGVYFLQLSGKNGTSIHRILKQN